MEQAVVRFKGKGNGIEVVFNAKASFDDIKRELRKKLIKNQAFLGAQSDIQVSVVSTSALNDDDKKELTDIFSDFFNTDGIEFIKEKRSEEAIKITKPEKHHDDSFDVESLKEDDIDGYEQMKKRQQTNESNIDNMQQRLTDIPSVYRQDDKSVFIKSTLRNGQRLNSEGNVIVMGDVNPGAQIVAGGNIVVLGRLRGVAHAGAWGDQNAIVFALKLQPTQLRIANIIAVAPADVEITDYPEVAQAKNGKIVIEPYED